MNIAIINAKDLFKYILKIFLILLIVYSVTKGIKKIDKVKDEQIIKQTIQNTTEQVNQKSFIKCLDLNIPLMSYKKVDNSGENIITSSKILGIGTGILEEVIDKNPDLMINQNELTQDDTEELANKIAELPENVTTESVLENNIIPKVTNSYNTVKIDNQSNYEITENMLVPNVEITNKKDIIIYHTHTCESYTPSSRI